MAPEALTLRTDDGVDLEAELDLGAGEAPPIALVLCHPHPQFGGTMRSIVTSVLFHDLPPAGYPCLRFNFRGVENSTGAYSEGKDEPRDAVAAITALAERLPDTPIVLSGWSFGGDIALRVTDERIVGWIAIAPPLRVGETFPAALDQRPKHLILAEHDEFREPADVQHDIASWHNTSAVVVPGASHFFVGRTDAVLAETRASLVRLTAH
jgi:hypothetical protein